MRKFYLLATALLIAGSAFADNWYIRGDFNDFNPNGDSKWELLPTEENPKIVTGTFSIPDGLFKFNLVKLNPDEVIFTPLSKTLYNESVEVTFTDDLFSGTSGVAWEDYDENCYWLNAGWTGGDISVTVYDTTNNPKIEIKNLGNSLPEVGGEAPVLTPIITEAEGRLQNYLRYGSGYFSMMGTIFQYDEKTEPSPSQIIFGDDNTIYFHDISDYNWDSFTKGEINGNKITVNLPQTLCEELYEWAEEPYYQNLCVLTQKGSGENISFTVDNSITSVTFTISEEGVITLDPLPEGKALGVMTYFIGKAYDDPDNIDEDAPYHLEWLAVWDGPADFTQRFQPIDVEKIEMPQDVETLTYYVVVNGYNYPIEVAFADNFMYMKGFGDSPATSEFVIRAELNGNEAIIPQNQYVGILYPDNEMIITKCGHRNGYNISYDDDNVGFELTIDNDRRIIQIKDNEQYLCFAYMMQIDPETKEEGLLSYYNNFTIIYQTIFPGTPANPFNLFAHDDFYDIFGYHVFGFDMVAFSTDNTILLTDNLYYSIYIDGELEVFEYDPDGVPYTHYMMLPEPTSEIPFLFTNDADLDIWTETERQVGYYYDGVTTMGVQAIYYYNGTRTVSDIVTLNLETGEVTVSAGIDSVVASSEVVKTEYFDLSGRKVSNPANGIFVKRSTLSDGSVVTKKIALK